MVLAAVLAVGVAAAVPGDVNCDGELDERDLDTLVVDLFASSTCGESDPNLDGFTSAADLLWQMELLHTGSATPTPTDTDIPEPTLTPTPALGPLITYFGIAGSSGRLALASGVTEDGVLVFDRTTGVGFKIVVEAAPGITGAAVGQIVLNSEPGNPNAVPDLQIQATRNLGNGNDNICLGGVPGIEPARFDAEQIVADAMNDFACRFAAATTRSATCTLDEFDSPAFARAESRVQFCRQIAAAESFTAGDTMVSVRIRDRIGNLGPTARLVVRLPGGVATSTRTLTPTSTPPPTTTRTASSTPSRVATATRTPTATPTRTPIPPTQTPSLAASSTVTRTPTGPPPTATQPGPTPTRTPTRATATGTASPTRTPTSGVGTPTRTNTAAIASPTLTPTRTPTGAAATPTRSPTRTATQAPGTPSRTPTRTPTGAATATRTRTRTPSPTPTPTGSGATGPRITFMGVIRADNRYNSEDLVGMSPEGIPIYHRPLGTGFVIVVEGRPGSPPRSVGGSSYNPDPGDPSVRPDLQVQANRNLGNGSATICDNLPPDAGGVPAINPPSFAQTQPISNAINDLGCRFVDGMGQPRGRASSEACVLTDDGEFRFFASNTTLQYCSVVVTGALRFPSGDTMVSARLRDTSGNVGAVSQIIIRVGN